MLKKRYLITKTIFQIFLYLFEVVGISYLLTSLSNKIWPTNNFMDYLERMTIFYTFYQIIIYGILQQLNDIKKDQYLALLSMYKYINLYIDSNDNNILNDIKKIIEKQLSSDIFNDNEIRAEYIDIKTIITDNKSFDQNRIQIKIIKYEHCYEEVTLNWKYSILTRLIK